jgi:hypothetical protein
MCCAARFQLFEGVDFTGTYVVQNACFSAFPGDV